MTTNVNKVDRSKILDIPNEIYVKILISLFPSGYLSTAKLAKKLHLQTVLILFESYKSI